MTFSRDTPLNNMSFDVFMAFSRDTPLKRVTWRARGI